MLKDAGLKNGLNICAGHVTHRELAEDLGMDYRLLIKLWLEFD